MALINLDKKGVKWEIRKAGYLTVNVDGVIHWEHQQSGRVDDAADELAIQAIIDNFSLIDYEKKLKISELKTEGVARIQDIFPAINDFDELDLVREQWLSIAPAARKATADFQSMIDIVQAGKAAASDINALTTIPEVQAYDVVNTPTWPA